MTHSYWPADRSRPILDLTAGDALREAARAAPDRGRAGHLPRAYRARGECPALGSARLAHRASWWTGADL